MTKKMVITIIGLFLFVFGYINTALSFGVYGIPGRFYSQTSMSSIYGIVVDSRGNIFFALSTNSIQVFDNTGSFLYRFAYATPGGATTFAIDSNDIIYVAVARGGEIQSFYDGYLVERRMFTHDTEFTELRNSRRQKYVDVEGNIYIIRNRVINMDVQMYNRYGNFVRNISRINVSPNPPAIARISYVMRIFRDSVRPIVPFLGIIMVFVTNPKLLSKAKLR